MISPELKKTLNHVSDWEDWAQKKKAIFNDDEWAAIDLKQMDREISRDPISINGVIWQPFSYPYKLSPETIDLYEEVEEYIFSRLDPDGHRENSSHPEWYGRKCNHCKIWTRSRAFQECPLCGRHLIVTPLNDD